VGYTHGVYTGLYASLLGYPVCILGYMPPYHATRCTPCVYTPYTHPGYTVMYTVWHGQRTRRRPVAGDEALGST